MSGIEVRFRANDITSEADAWPRGYRHTGRTWAVVDVLGMEIVAVDDAGLAGMQRLIDALTTALAQARQAEADEALTALDFAGAQS